MKRTYAAIVLTLGILPAAEVPYPAGYRKWTVTKSFLAGPDKKNAGFHLYYANSKALEGFATGTFPDGSVIVDERIEPEQREGSTFEGKRLGIEVMMKDSKRYAATGGWAYESAFGEAETLSAPADRRAACFACHQKQKDRDYVFSTMRK